MKNMRKTISAAAAALIVLSCVSFAFADSGASALSASTAGEAGAPIRLSLKDAVKIMQTAGTSAETAQINRNSDKAVAEGYSESVTAIRNTLDKLDYMQDILSRLPGGAPGAAELNGAYWKGLTAAQSQGATGINEKIMKLRRDFAKGQIDSNYQAEMNQIEYITVQAYYGALLAQENLKIAGDNVKAQQDILKNVEAQFKEGMAARKDALFARASLEAAKSDLETAQSKLENAKRSFNFLLGYPVMQEVVFTDKLAEAAFPSIELDKAISAAKENRNEIKGARFAKEVHGVLLENLRYQYPVNSSTYLNEQAACLNAEKSAKDAPSQVEIDIRNRWDQMVDLKAAIISAQAVKSYAEEGYRLIQLSYEAGMCTLSELQQVQVSAYKASLGVAAATTNYDLAVCDFGYAISVGTARLPL